MLNVSNFERFDPALFDVSIVQQDVGGGKTEKAEIDRLAEFPEAKSLMISGLNQECFEYLIRQYGRQFEAISFWKNKLISDLSPLGFAGYKIHSLFFESKSHAFVEYGAQ